MIERRNFYRILHVQPDASMAVIQENYRLLRQKLKIHPNLSGADWNENLLEAAYQTLSNSSKGLPMMLNYCGIIILTR